MSLITPVYRRRLSEQHQEKYDTDLNIYNNERFMYFAIIVFFIEVLTLAVKFLVFKDYMQTPLFTYELIMAAVSALFFLFFSNQYKNRRYNNIVNIANIIFLVFFCAISLLIHNYELLNNYLDFSYILCIFLLAALPVFNQKKFLCFALPVLLVSVFLIYNSKSGEMFQMILSHAIYLGIALYLSKQLFANYVNFYVAGEELAQNEEQLLNVVSKMEELYITDEKTGLLNSRGMINAIDTSLSYYTRDKKNVSFLICDIDLFKSFNDVYGHLEGDNALLQVAKTIRGTCKRRSDIVARHGQEKFIVFFSSDLNGTQILAGRIKDNIEALKIPHEQSSHGILTISIGIANVITDDSTSVDYLMQVATKALSIAKNEGRNAIRVCHE